MRNLKRALSLALACVMLLGMMVMGTSASTFNDADSIVNKEAVEIAAGLGLFAGTDGNFMPTGTVTRAQMATIIVKMLYGSDFNADSYKGMNTFSDTAAFEGGWAEGYINACVARNVVSGYGDGTFKPGNPVTTAEAITMIINALKVDAGEGTWPMTVMAKAEEMKLFGELSPKPQTNVALTRDALAVICVEGLQYSPKGTKGYAVAGIDTVFEDYLEAWIAAGQEASKISSAAQDTLATTVFDLKTVEGFVTGNQTTGKAATVINEDVAFDIETDLSMIGHYVTVYYAEEYTSEEKPGVAYAVVDQSTVITVDKPISTAKDYKAAFGNNYDVAENGFLFDGTYLPTPKSDDDLIISGYTKGAAALPGTYIIANGKIVAYIDQVEQYASFVVDVNTSTTNGGVLINGANGGKYIPNVEGNDMVVEYAGIATGDYITYTVAQGVYVLSPVSTVSGPVTKSSTTKINGATYSVLTVDGKQIVAYGGDATGLGRKLNNDVLSIQYGQNYDLYVAADGRYLGFKAAVASADLSQTAYILGVFDVSEQDSYGKKTINYKARGVDMEGKEVMILLAKVTDADKNGAYTEGEDILGDESVVKTGVAAGFYTAENSTNKNDKKAGIQVLKPYTETCTAAGDTFVTTNTSTDGKTSYTGSAGLVTADGKYTYASDNTKFIVIEGDADTAGPLEVAVQLKSIPSMKLSTKYPMLVTRTANGAKNALEVMIIQGDMDDILGNTSTYVTYITEEQLDDISTTADGTAYTVYKADTTETTELVVSEPITVPGFYKVVSNSDGTNAVTRLTGEKDAATKSLMYTNLSFGGMHTSTRMFAGNTEKTLGAHTTKSLKVVDLRTDSEIELSGVPKISSLEQLNLLYDGNPEMVVIFDLYVTDASTDAANGMYITKAHRTTPGLGTIVYAAAAPEANGGTQTLSVVRSNSLAMGEPISVAYETSDAQEIGFYEFCVNGDGQLALVKLGFKGLNDAVTGYRGTMAIHNTIVSFDDDILTTTSKTDAACDDSANEAMSVVSITDATRIFNADGEEVGTEVLVKGAVINYYCSTATHKDDAAVSDNTVELIFVTEVCAD
ncbi:MAG: S-layer homology domain-containing protein [Oscillospiraceae bacterium]|nr:S-layer homology domain-containing protein [Oscillospiraceae bacterium]